MKQRGGIVVLLIAGATVLVSGTLVVKLLFKPVASARAPRTDEKIIANISPLPTKQPQKVTLTPAGCNPNLDLWPYLPADLKDKVSNDKDPPFCRTGHL